MWRCALVFVLALACTPAAADDTPQDARARILAIEMARGPVEDLLPFVRDGNTDLWKQAVRAAGRIGDVSSDFLPDLLEAHAPGDDGSCASCPAPRLLLWSAGLPFVSNTDADDAARTSWSRAVRPFLKASEENIVAAAAHALGWISDDTVGSDLLPLLHDPRAVVRAEALNALGRAGREGYLERCLRFLHDEHADVRAAARFAGWRLAGRRRAAATKDGTFAGDTVLAKQALTLLDDADPEVRMGALRIAGVLLDDTASGGVQTSLERCARDTDPRVAQDYVWRILQPRKGAWVDQQLIGMALRADPKIRGMAYDALAGRETAETLEALRARAKDERDPRLLDQLAVALAKRGDLSLVSRLLTAAQGHDPVLRSMRRAEAFVAMKSARASAVLMEWLTPERAEAGVEHTAVWMTALGGLSERDDDDVRAWIQKLATSASLRAKRPYLAASALEALGKSKSKTAWDALRTVARAVANEKPIADVDNALMGALVAARPEGDAGRDALVGELLLRVAAAHSDFARQTAVGHLAKLVPEVDGGTPEPGNDWDGLPRPEQPLPGLKLTGTEPKLREGEILRIADWIAAVKPVCVFETTEGTIRVTLHPESAPVHCVNLLLACHTNLYAGTRFHRVVPNFVIQGGDPHGHGAGSGGWTVPDEITPWEYDRGALGMPKSTKDDGGCQIFIMHTGYRPLDERYTNYATVVEGMDAVDRIRVGDLIERCRIEIP